MYFNKGYYSSDKDNIFYLAPIPLYIKQYDDKQARGKWTNAKTTPTKKIRTTEGNLYVITAGQIIRWW